MNIDKYQYFMGIDVQIRRRCPYLILNHKKICVSSGWLERDSKDGICGNLLQLINALENNGIGTIAIGIDAPRVPLSTTRKYFWDGKRNRWKGKSGQRGYGRHCEVILKSLNIANP
jgi:hypothetical protein